jgi:hypothetical protein
MRKAVFGVVCLMLLLIASSSGVVADDFGNCHCTVNPDPGPMMPCADLAAEPGLPDWDWDQNNQIWEMDWDTQTYGFQLDIETTGIIVDMCDAQHTKDIKCEMVLDVDLNNGQQTWQRIWRNPSWPAADTCDGTHTGLNTIMGTTANVQVNVMVNDVIDVDLAFTVWDCNQNPPVDYDTSATGQITVS